MASLHVEVSFFSRLRELAGTPNELYFVDEGATLGDLLCRVYIRHPQLQPLDASLLLARNARYASREEALEDGDRVDLMPPVSGG